MHQNDGNNGMIGAMAKLMRLKQACCHRSMVKRVINNGCWDTFQTQLNRIMFNLMTSSEFRENRLDEIRALLVDGTCPVCYDGLEGAVVAYCGHVYCVDCAHTIMTQGNRKCPECRVVWTERQESERFVEVPVNIISRDNTNETFEDSSKTEMICGILKKYLSGVNMIDKGCVVKNTSGEIVSLSEPFETEDNKFVVFSQFSQMLDILEESFRASGGFRWVRIDGSVGLKARQERLGKFRREADVQVLLCTYRTAGEGLNLVNANHVILADLWWNSAVEDQAVDRVHRIGQ